MCDHHNTFLVFLVIVCCNGSIVNEHNGPNVFSSIPAAVDTPPDNLLDDRYLRTRSGFINFIIDKGCSYVSGYVRMKYVQGRRVNRAIHNVSSDHIDWERNVQNAGQHFHVPSEFIKALITCGQNYSMAALFPIDPSKPHDQFQVVGKRHFNGSDNDGRHPDNDYYEDEFGGNHSSNNTIWDPFMNRTTNEEFSKHVERMCTSFCRIDDCIDKIGNANYAIKFDLLKGFWYIPLTERSKEISVFVTSDGLYQLLPLGIKGSTNTFQRFMNLITSGLANCDDAIIYNDTWKEHLATIRKFFDCLTYESLTVNLSKGEICHASVAFLGHIAGHGQVKPIDGKVKAISEFPIAAVLREDLTMTAYGVCSGGLCTNQLKCSFQNSESEFDRSVHIHALHTAQSPKAMRYVKRRYHLDDIPFIRFSMSWLLDVYKMVMISHVRIEYIHGLVGCGMEYALTALNAPNWLTRFYNFALAMEMHASNQLHVTLTHLGKK